MENGAKVIKGKYCYILTICLVLVFIFTCYRSGFTYKKLQESCSRKEDPITEAPRNSSCKKPSQDVTLERMLYPMPEVTKPTRTDVMMVTPWLAPIVWNGAFNIDILNAQFHKRDVRIGLTLFALKKYTVFLKNFIETAEKYFMVGHKVHYYVFTDRPQDIPSLSLAEGRTLNVTEVTSYKRWQDVTMRRMQIISENCLQRFIYEVDYLVCADVDMIFSDHVGVEILSDVFAAIHPGFFQLPRQKFTHERRPESQGFIPKDEGDYYYTGCYFGGTVEEIYKVANFCHNAMMADKAKNIEALWHDESYLNRYFLYYKPTKVLSPEYVWNNYYGSSVYVPSKRFVHVEKDYVRIRSD